MATTDTTGAEVGTTRRRRTARAAVWSVCAASVAVLAVGLISVAQGGDDVAPPRPFWSLITPVTMAVDPPQNLDDIANRSDAIVVAHVTGVGAGREQKGFFDPSPPLPGSQLPRSSYVELTVDRVVSGDVSAGQKLTLETLAAPPSPLTYADVVPLMPTDGLLFFLTNNGASGRKAGFGTTMDPIENSLWGLASDKAVIAAGPSGLYEALDPNGTDLTFLQSFAATTVDDAASHAQEALH